MLGYVYVLDAVCSMPFVFCATELATAIEFASAARARFIKSAF